jgi:hypothetical protein
MKFVFALPPHIRPADVPADWRVYCAPRPLPGQQCWQGEFLAGVFYAANPPDTDEADINSLHGRRVFYLTDEQVKTLVTDWIQRHEPADEAPDSIQACEDHDFWREQLHYSGECLQSADEVEAWINAAL